MDENKVISKDENTVHDLSEFHFAKEVVKDFPKIIAVYSKLLPVLYHWAHYTCVWSIITAVEDAKYLAEFQLKYYQTVFDTKGRVKNVK